MKQIPEILQMIKTKTTEHTKIISEVENDIQLLRAKIQKMANEGNRTSHIEEASKLLVLKDKVIFHKACVLVLNDLKKEIEA